MFKYENNVRTLKVEIWGSQTIEEMTMINIIIVTNPIKISYVAGT